ncbi:Pseudaminic acid cytidylyltransferase [Desulfovibrionales bacterium]
MILCVIPARSGSKRVPDKNIRPFANQPLISYSIAAAFQSGVFDRVVISTDSEAIAAVARKLGAEVPFLRSPELSDDFTPTAPVLLHAIRAVVAEGQVPQYVCCLYATAPFVRPEDLVLGYETIRATGASSVFSVTTFAFPIFRALKCTEIGTLAMLWPEHELTRSNDLIDVYHDAGQFYWVDGLRFLDMPCFYTLDARPVVLPRVRVQDIDTLEDWEMAENMFRAHTCVRDGEPDKS